MQVRPRIVPAGRIRRLAEELDEIGFGFVGAGAHGQIVMEELDVALHPHIHEGTLPASGVLVAPTTPIADWGARTGLRASIRPTVDHGDREVRRYADGMASWAVRHGDNLDELVVFDRPAGSERDLVVLSEVSGAVAVQRVPSGVVRVVGSFGVLRHDLGGWHHEPPPGSWIEGVPGCVREGNRTVLGHLLEFAVHDLGADRIGSMLIMHPSGRLLAGHEHRLPAPPALSVIRPEDLAPLRHALTQTDGAAVFDADGVLRAMGVRLIPSAAAEEAVAPVGGTRHTSALRYSADDPLAVVAVVSDDGPVTVMREGRLVGRSPMDIDR